MTRGQHRAVRIYAVLGVAALAGALILVASPYHRAFYIERPIARLAPERLATVPATPPPPSLSTRPVGVAAGVPMSTIVTKTRRSHLSDDEGRRRIPIADPMPGRLPVEGVPPSWELKEFAGRANIELIRSDIGAALHLRSDRTSFALYRDLVVDLGEFPILSWAWKVTRLPTGGDVRRAATDDQAAQVYVVFPRWPSPRTSSDVLGYVWDTTAPVGTHVVSPKAPNVHIIVVESGPAGLGAWRRQARNVAQDYQALFGRRPPRVGTLAVMIDANDTASTAEAMIGDFVFSRTDR